MVDGVTIVSRADLDFLLYDWLDVESLTARARDLGGEAAALAVAVQSCSGWF